MWNGIPGPQAGNQRWESKVGIKGARLELIHEFPWTATTAGTYALTASRISGTQNFGDSIWNQEAQRDLLAMVRLTTVGKDWQGGSQAT